jgi:hypothetical protein
MSSNTAPSTEHIEHLTTLTRAKGFLGREFLTWLWYVSETSSESYTVRDEGSGKDLVFDLWIDDRLVLESTSAQMHENVMKGGDPSQSHEAAAALTTGKTVKEMRLGVNVKNIGEFTAILNGEDLNPRSLKLPNPNKDDSSSNGDDLPIVARLRYTDTFMAVLDGLFSRFLALRTEEHWQTASLMSMRDWVKKRSTAFGNKADSLH